MSSTTADAQAHMQAAAEARKALADERKSLELALQIAVREEKNAKAELRELHTAAKEYDEQLTSLKDRVAAVTSELSQLKLNSSLTQTLVEHGGDDTENDPNLEITSFRQISNSINAAFRSALKSRLTDPDFVERLSDQHSSSRPEYCHVIWGSESADWKVHDPRDGTEVTFGALLEDVSRYWGLHHADMVFCDAKGAAWPVEPYVWDELGATVR